MKSNPMNIHNDKMLYLMIAAAYAIFLTLLFIVFSAEQGWAAGIFAVLLAVTVPLFCWASATLYKWMVLDRNFKNPLSNASGTFVNSMLWNMLFGILLLCATAAAYITWQHLKAAFPATEIMKSPVSVIPTPDHFPKPAGKD